LFKWEKPSKIDFIEAGAKSILRWQNTFAGTGDIEYSLADNNWLPLATGVDLTKNHFYWNVPDTISPVVVRMKIANSHFYSDTFFITSLLKPTTGFVCGDSLLIYWNKLKNVSQYQLYQLGEKYMEPFLITADTTSVISKNNLSNSFIAVAPVLSNGKTAEKSYAFDFSKQGAGCFINSFYTNKDGAVAKLNLIMGTLINVASINFEKQEGAEYINIATPAVTGQLDYHVNYSPLKKGIVNFRVKVILKNGQVIYSNPEAVFYAAPGEYVLLPVPVKKNSLITVISTSPEGELLIITDVTGRQVLQKKLIAVQDYINTSLLPAGIYFYQVIKTGKRISAGKLVVL